MVYMSVQEAKSPTGTQDLSTNIFHFIVMKLYIVLYSFFFFLFLFCFVLLDNGFSLEK